MDVFSDLRRPSVPARALVVNLGETRLFPGALEAVKEGVSPLDGRRVRLDRTYRHIVASRALARRPAARGGHRRGR